MTFYRSFLSLLPLVVLCSPPARAGDEALQPRIDTGLKLGTERSLGTIEAWVPLSQQTDRVIYGDVRVMKDSQDNAEGNLGLGYRQIVTAPITGQKVVAGAHGWIDRRHTDQGSTFHQATLGTEMLGRDVDLRGNIYIPLNDEKIHETSNIGSSSPYLAGTGIYYDTGGRVIEEPQPGFDLELGYRVPVFEEQVDSIRIYGGGYHFSGDHTPDVTGWRTRVTADISSAVSVGARFQHDAERGSQGFLEATLRFPFGSKKTFARDSLRARLDESPERDIDIVAGSVVQDSGLRKPVLTSSTGSEQRVLHVDNTAAPGGDGSKERPFNLLKNAEAVLQAHDIIYLHAGDGTTTGQDQGVIINQPDVALIGSGVDFVYSGGKFTTSSGEDFSGQVIEAATTAPVIKNTEVNTTNFTGVGIFVTADRIQLSGIQFDATTTGNNIYAYNNTGTIWDSFTVSDVTTRFSNAVRGEGVRVEITGAGSKLENLSINNVETINNTRGISVSASLDAQIETALIENIEAHGAALHGILTIASSGSRIGSAAIRNATLYQNTTGLILGTQTFAGTAANIETALIENVTATNNVNNIQINAQNDNRLGAITLRNITANNTTAVTGTSGVRISSLSGSSLIDSVHLDNVTASGNNTHGIHIPMNTLSGITSLSVENSTFTGNRLDGIYVDDETTGTYGLDFGGGASGQAGNNSIFGNGTAGGGFRDVALDLDGSVIPLPMQHNWWGQPGGPLAGRVRTETGGVVPAANTGNADTSNALATAP